MSDFLFYDLILFLKVRHQMSSSLYKCSSRKSIKLLLNYQIIYFQGGGTFWYRFDMEVLLFGNIWKSFICFSIVVSTTIDSLSLWIRGFTHGIMQPNLMRVHLCLYSRRGGRKNKHYNKCTWCKTYSISTLRCLTPRCRRESWTEEEGVSKWILI